MLLVVLGAQNRLRVGSICFEYKTSTGITNKRSRSIAQV